MIAYGTQRTLILESHNWRYAPGGWETVFLPVSNTCTDRSGASTGHWSGIYTLTLTHTHILSSWVRHRLGTSAAFSYCHFLFWLSQLKRRPAAPLLVLFLLKHFGSLCRSTLFFRCLIANKSCGVISVNNVHRSEEHLSVLWMWYQSVKGPKHGQERKITSDSGWRYVIVHVFLNGGMEHTQW